MAFKLQLPKTPRARWGLATAGALIAAALVFVFVRQHNQQVEAEALARKKSVVEYTAAEQKRVGVDCLKLKGQLQMLVDKRLARALDKRASGKDWSRLVTKATKESVTRHREFTFTCVVLYKAGDGGRLNGLQELAYTADIQREMGVLDTLLQEGPPRKNCDRGCMDRLFAELADTHGKVSARLRAQP
jgi:hypothetical protein